MPLAFLGRDFDPIAFSDVNYWQIATVFIPRGRIISIVRVEIPATQITLVWCSGGMTRCAVGASRVAPKRCSEN